MSEMEYAKIPYVEKPVSRILFGTAAPPYFLGQEGDALLDAVLSMGVNVFDLARNYMGAEISIGNWMEKRGNRDDLVLLSKCAHPSFFGGKRVTEEDIRKDFRKSSEYLHTGYIDIYLLHRDDPDVDPGVPVEIFNAMHAEGKIGAFGGSNWKHQRVEQANEYAYKHNLIPFTVSSPNFGLAEQVADPWGGGCETISGPSNREAREWYQKNSIPVIAYSSLGRGLFSGRVKGDEPEKAAEVLDEVAMKGYACEANFERLRRCEQMAKKKDCRVPQIAMAWIYQQPVQTFAVVSTSKPERMQENVDALSVELTPEELAWLDLQN